ncbi:MAG: tRNA (adenosine(37)-N6)-threonylcarbamoyltransferase complex dimerization subunit type 1 TsaB [Acidobacteriota bacterium]
MPTPPHAPILAIDTAGAVASVALVTSQASGAIRRVPQRESSKSLLRLVDEVLQESGLELAEIGGIAAARGPGSFTGLRVGLATALGLAQSTALPAAAVPTLEAIAESARGQATKILAVLDAHREHWFAQSFRLDPEAPPEPCSPLEAATRISATELLATRELSNVQLVGANAAPLEEAFGAALDSAAGAEAVARVALRRPELWNLDLLTRPLYLLPPPATPPRPRRAPGG